MNRRHGDVSAPPAPTGIVERQSRSTSQEAYYSMFCYPWDVLDHGIDQFASLGKELGLTHISLAASYHGGKALLPHNNKRHVYFIEDGAVYFRPSSKNFKDAKLKPRVSQLASRSDPFRKIVEACQKRGLSTTAWTVTLHNTHLGSTYPEVAIQNVFGDRYLHSLCPSQPAVRDYMRSLTRNLASYPIDAVEFESLEFVPFRHYGFLEKEGIELTPLAVLLLSLCFCPACLSAARRARIDGKTVAKAATRWLLGYFDGQNRICEPIEVGLQKVPGLAEYLNVRFDVLSAAFEELAAVLHEKNKRAIYLLINHEQPREYLTGIDVCRIATATDAIETLFYARAPNEAAAVMAKLRKSIGQDRRIYFAVRPGFPDANGSKDVLWLTRSVLSAGADGLSYYNFGLLESYRLQDMRDAIRATRGKHSKCGGLPALDTERSSEAETSSVRPNVLRQGYYAS